jgi:hypothetical protein
VSLGTISGRAARSAGTRGAGRTATGPRAGSGRGR